MFGTSLLGHANAHTRFPSALAAVASDVHVQSQMAVDPI